MRGLRVVADVVYWAVIVFLVGRYYLADPMDVNRDGAVNVLDVQMLVNRVLEGEGGE